MYRWLTCARSAEMLSAPQDKADHDSDRDTIPKTEPAGWEVRSVGAVEVSSVSCDGDNSTAQRRESHPKNHHTKILCSTEVKCLLTDMFTQVFFLQPEQEGCEYRLRQFSFDCLKRSKNTSKPGTAITHDPWDAICFHPNPDVQPASHLTQPNVVAEKSQHSLSRRETLSLSMSITDENIQVSIPYQNHLSRSLLIAEERIQAFAHISQLWSEITVEWRRPYPNRDFTSQLFRKIIDADIHFHLSILPQVPYQLKKYIQVVESNIRTGENKLFHFSDALFGTSLPKDEQKNMFQVLWIIWDEKTVLAFRRVWDVRSCKIRRAGKRMLNSIMVESSCWNSVGISKTRQGSS